MGGLEDACSHVRGLAKAPKRLLVLSHPADVAEVLRQHLDKSWHRSCSLSTFVGSLGWVDRKRASNQSKIEETRNKTRKSHSPVSSPHLIFPRLDSISQKMGKAYRESGPGTQRVSECVSPISKPSVNYEGLPSAGGVSAPHSLWPATLSPPPPI